MIPLCSEPLFLYTDYFSVSVPLYKGIVFSSAPIHPLVSAFSISMAIVKSSPRPSCVKAMRASRLRKCDPLDRWLASVTMKTAPGIFLQSPLPDDQAMCELFMSVHKACFLRFWPGHGNSCLICVSGCLRDHPYPRSRSLPLAHEATNNMHLARYVGSPADDDAPLWVRRLPPRRFLRFPQPLDFIGKLVGGMTDISVEPLLVSCRCGLYIYDCLLNCWVDRTMRMMRGI